MSGNGEGGTTEARLRSILETVPDAIDLLDADLVEMNERQVGRQFECRPCAFR